MRIRAGWSATLGALAIAGAVLGVTTVVNATAHHSLPPWPKASASQTVWQRWASQERSYFTHHNWKAALGPSFAAQGQKILGVWVNSVASSGTGGIPAGIVFDTVTVKIQVNKLARPPQTSAAATSTRSGTTTTASGTNYCSSTFTSVNYANIKDGQDCVGTATASNGSSTGAAEYIYTASRSFPN